MGKTLFEKIWGKHLVEEPSPGMFVLYIDRHFIHEVTSPQAFSGLKKKERRVFRPAQTTATVDHNVPTRDQHLPIRDRLSAEQVDRLRGNCSDQGIELFDLGDERNGIVHVTGPEQGLTLPGMTIVCGDSHTSTHGAFGCIAFGIGTSEVEMVLASQCLFQSKPGQMRITLNGKPGPATTAKDIILYVISRIGHGGAAGYFVEFSGEAVRAMNMEERMTLCNMSIEMGARGGLIAPDEKTREWYEAQGISVDSRDWYQWQSDAHAVFDKEFSFSVSGLSPMITYGTDPGSAIPVNGRIPEDAHENALAYMGFEKGEALLGKKIGHVFIGSCTNARISDLRGVAGMLKNKKKHPEVNVILVPGSNRVRAQMEKEGLMEIFLNAGIEVRQPGCSACLGMNEDKIPSGAYCVSTSNRNFEGRQGPGARTLLVSPLTAAATILTGKITDPAELLLS